MRSFLKDISLCVGLSVIGQGAMAFDIVDSASALEADPNETYLFYSHGFIVEGTDPRPIHPRYGVYDFPAVKVALEPLASHIIARQRPKGTNPADYAKGLAAEVRSLIKRGVPADHITILGFSQGGRITAYASGLLADIKVKTIIMAGCGGWVKQEPTRQVAGDVFSIREESDVVPSCQSVANRSPAVDSFQEVMIHTGKGHGAFYLPRPDWLDPIAQWLKAHASAS